MKYRKKPVLVEAVQWTGHNLDKISEFTGKYHAVIQKGKGTFQDCLVIKTLEGYHYATPGDWIIRGIKGEYYPCKPDIFEATYEPADNA